MFIAVGETQGRRSILYMVTKEGIKVKIEKIKKIKKNNRLAPCKKR